MRARCEYGFVEFQPEAVRTQRTASAHIPSQDVLLHSLLRLIYRGVAFLQVEASLLIFDLYPKSRLFPLKRDSLGGVNPGLRIRRDRRAPSHIAHSLTISLDVLPCGFAYCWPPCSSIFRLSFILTSNSTRMSSYSTNRCSSGFTRFRRQIRAVAASPERWNESGERIVFSQFGRQGSVGGYILTF